MTPPYDNARSCQAMQMAIQPGPSDQCQIISLDYQITTPEHNTRYDSVTLDDNIEKLLDSWTVL